MASKHNTQTLHGARFVINLDTERLVLAHYSDTNTLFTAFTVDVDDLARIDRYAALYCRKDVTVFPNMGQCELWRLHSGAISESRAVELAALVTAA